jgi:hypothetical protein
VERLNGNNIWTILNYVKIAENISNTHMGTATPFVPPNARLYTQDVRHAGNTFRMAQVIRLQSVLASAQ